MRVRMRIQLRASLSGASSGSGNDGWFFNTTRREVIASISVSRFDSELSLVRRMSTGENKLKMSSVDSGSSQNCTRVSKTAVKCGAYRLESAHPSPVRVIRRDIFLLRKAKDALLKGQFRLRSPHDDVGVSRAWYLKTCN